MFRNLNAEQARHNLTNAAVAEMMGISRRTYEKKKKSGKFTVSETMYICDVFHCKPEYLFATDEETK